MLSIITTKNKNKTKQHKKTFEGDEDIYYLDGGGDFMRVCI